MYRMIWNVLYSVVIYVKSTGQDLELSWSMHMLWSLYENCVL